MKRAYAYECAKCHHFSSDHRLVVGGRLVEGPYRCLYCPCEIPQDGPHIPLTRREVEAMAESTSRSVVSEWKPVGDEET